MLSHRRNSLYPNDINSHCTSDSLYQVIMHVDGLGTVGGVEIKQTVCVYPASFL